MDVSQTGREQRVTALELFFDLVVVFAITQVTDLISHDPDHEWPPERSVPAGGPSGGRGPVTRGSRIFSILRRAASV
jgi:hypothetical protein